MATERKKTGSRSSSSAGRKTSGRSRKRNKKQSTVQEAIGFALIVLGVFSFAAVVIGGAGWLGKGLADVFFGLFGLGAYLVPVLMAGMFSFAQMISACVPLPAPGAPNRIRFIGILLSLYKGWFFIESAAV